jgi:hypothetical protein
LKIYFENSAILVSSVPSHCPAEIPSRSSFPRCFPQMQQKFPNLGATIFGQWHLIGLKIVI